MINLLLIWDQGNVEILLSSLFDVETEMIIQHPWARVCTLSHTEFNQS